jgi:hypothetical protein
VIIYVEYWVVIGDQTYYFQSNALNGSFPVVDTPDEFTLDFVVPKNPEELVPPEPPFSNIYTAVNASIGVRFHGAGADGGTGGTVRGNRVFHMTIGSYHDTYSSKDVTYAGNYYSDVSTPVLQFLSQTDFPLNNISSLVCSGTTATLTTMQPHRLLPGLAVQVSNVRVGGALSLAYNGFFEVESVPSATLFTYKVSSDPGGDADASPLLPNPSARYWVEFFRNRNVLVERNVMELRGSPQFNQRATGVQCFGGTFLKPEFSVHRRLDIRDNLIRHHEGRPNPHDVGASISNYQVALLHGNVFGLTEHPAANVFGDDVLGRSGYFNNQRMNGSRVLPFQRNQDQQRTGLKRTDLHLLVQDAILTGL